LFLSLSVVGLNLFDRALVLVGRECWMSAVNFSSELCRVMSAKQNAHLTRSLKLIIKLLCSVQRSSETAYKALRTVF